MDLLAFDVGKVIKQPYLDGYQVDIKKYESPLNIVECEYKVAYYDKEGNVLCYYPSYNDVPINPGKSVNVITFADLDT